MRTKQDIRAIIAGAVADRLEQRKTPMTVQDLLDETALTDTGLDSLDMVEIWLESEERLGYEIPEEEVRAAKTFGDIVEIAVVAQTASAIVVPAATNQRKEEANVSKIQSPS